MNKSEVNRFKKLYESHQRSLKLQGKAQKTIDAYSRAIRRVRDYFDCCPDRLKPEQFKKGLGQGTWTGTGLGQEALYAYKKL